MTTVSVHDTLQARRVPSLTPLAILPAVSHMVYGVAFSPDRQTLATGSRNGVTTLWDASNWQQRCILSTPTDIMCCLVFSRDGKRLGTATRGKAAQVWNSEDGSLLWSVPGPSSHIDISASGQRVVTTRTKKAYVWDACGNPLFEVFGHTSTVCFALFSNDELYLTTSSGKLAFVWSTLDGTLVSQLQDCRGAINDMAFGNRTNTIVAACHDNCVRVWDAASGVLIHQFVHDDHVFSVRFSADDRVVVSSSFDRTIRLWDTASGVEQLVLHHPEQMHDAAISSDSARVAGLGSGYPDNVVWVWDRHHAKLLAQLHHPNGTSRIAFGAGDESVAIGCHDGNVYIWNLAGLD